MLDLMVFILQFALKALRAHIICTSKNDAVYLCVCVFAFNRRLNRQMQINLVLRASLAGSQT